MWESRGGFEVGLRNVRSAQRKPTRRQALIASRNAIPIGHDAPVYRYHRETARGRESSQLGRQPRSVETLGLGGCNRRVRKARRAGGSCTCKLLLTRSVYAHELRAPVRTLIPGWVVPALGLCVDVIQQKRVLYIATGAMIAQSTQDESRLTLSRLRIERARTRVSACVSVCFCVCMHGYGTRRREVRRRREGEQTGESTPTGAESCALYEARFAYFHTCSRFSVTRSSPVPS